jgi:hypothetical protein
MRKEEKVECIQSKPQANGAHLFNTVAVDAIWRATARVLGGLLLVVVKSRATRCRTIVVPIAHRNMETLRRGERETNERNERERERRRERRERRDKKRGAGRKRDG